MTKTKIKFKGKEYFTGAIIENGKVLKNSWIATEYQFSNGLCSYAHLFEDGSIKRFGEKIGSIGDIEIIGEKDIELKPEMLKNTLTHPSWD